MRRQRFATQCGSAGPTDGVMGVEAWAGVQRSLRMAGYAGPVDGVLGPNSYRGFAALLNRSVD